MNSSNRLGQLSVPPASAGGFLQHCLEVNVDSTAQRSQTQSGRRVHPRTSPASQSGTNRLYSTYGGTAGQEGLNIMNTIIKCPTLLSHFWDEWDKNGKSYAFTREPTQSADNSRPHRSTGFTPKGVTLTFSWDTGTGDKTGRLGRIRTLRNLDNSPLRLPPFHL
jgi:hypothetical protein